jgi:saccharopine dehydrogenase-like NADP-dependent oxidoreductase
VGVPNPLNYKFSWSPRGVLVATNNGARYLEDGSVVDVGAGTNIRELALVPCLA